MIIPSVLKPGDKIGIVSTASKIDQAVVEPAIDLLRSMDFRVKVGQHVYDQYHQFAGSDKDRNSDLQNMLDDPDIKVIICSRGGYGSLRAIEQIDIKSLLKNPKWIVGFSDVTVLHSQLNRLKIASVHGVMPRYFLEKDLPSPSFETLMNALSGQPLNYILPPSEFNKTGTARGELVGGNLSILYSLRGTPYDIDTDEKILFIEDLSEYLYHLDRIMMNLKLGGKLARLKGLIVGAFTAMKDNDTPFGKTVEQIILDAVSAYSFPVLFNFPAGHQSTNYAIKMGCTANINITSDHASFSQ